ncbi:hypothetical protein L1049_022116 [Liquidambar formosana]|uniref:Uncharacterized protein n=1 Tax=Liquidambar formosana TaxID=63359 RepID=A0AAP0RD99_LIQFO
MLLADEINQTQLNRVVCSAGGFQQLQVLGKNLESLNVEEGAMRSLKMLELDRCLKLKMIPDGLQYITTLQKFTVYTCGQEHTSIIQHAFGVDRWKINHIPSIELYGGTTETSDFPVFVSLAFNPSNLRQHFPLFSAVD